MVKIQVKGKGYHPRIGFLPKLKPFYAEQNTIGWLLNDPMKLSRNVVKCEDIVVSFSKSYAI